MELNTDEASASFIDTQRPGRAGRPDIKYAMWAEKYVDAVEATCGKPMAKLMAENPGFDEDALRSILNKARKRGLLSNSPSGRAGGNLTAKAEALLTERKERGYPEGFPTLIAELVELRASIAEMRDRERVLVETIHDTAEQRKTETPSGLVEISKRRNRKWDHDELIRNLTRVALDTREFDPATGELLERPTWERVADAIKACAGIGYWRTGALKDHGLNPDEFVETTSTAMTVTIR